MEGGDAFRGRCVSEPSTRNEMSILQEKQGLLGSKSWSGNGGRNTAMPAPFLLKTYEMVDDPVTDYVICWSSPGTSSVASPSTFIIWDLFQLSNSVLPKYFKHKNFSSFVRQLNTYGFHKTDPDRWEFAHKEFVKGQRHRLNNIRRKKAGNRSASSSSAVQVANAAAGCGLGSPTQQQILAQLELEKLKTEKDMILLELRRLNSHHSSVQREIRCISDRHRALQMQQEQMTAFLSRTMCFFSYHPRNVVIQDDLSTFPEIKDAEDSIVQKRRRIDEVNWREENTPMLSAVDTGNMDSNSVGSYHKDGTFDNNEDHIYTANLENIASSSMGNCKNNCFDDMDRQHAGNEHYGGEEDQTSACRMTNDLIDTDRKHTPTTYDCQLSGINAMQQGMASLAGFQILNSDREADGMLNIKHEIVERSKDVSTSTNVNDGSELDLQTRHDVQNDHLGLSLGSSSCDLMNQGAGSSRSYLSSENFDQDFWEYLLRPISLNLV